MAKRAYDAMIEALPMVEIRAEWTVEIVVSLDDGLVISGTPARFGTMPTEDGLKASFVLADPLNCVGELHNAAAVEGKFVVCERGGSPFTDKVKLAEKTGACGVVVIQNQEKWPHVMDDTTGAGAAIGIPATMICSADGERLKQHCRDKPFQAVEGSLSTRELRSCAICQEAFGAQALQLPCRHRFHKDCVGPWLRKNASCPLCRAAIPCPSVDDLAFWRQEFQLADRIASRECEVDMFG